MVKKSTAAQPDLDRDGPQPLYEQLKARLIEEFNNAPSSAEHGLSDAALMARFGVSRMTVRNAVAELVRAGLVRRIPGRGTFLVREPRLALDFDSLDRFFYEWHMPELDRVTKVLVFRYITPPPQIARALHVSRDAKVLMLRRLRSITGTPATLTCATWSIGARRRLRAPTPSIICSSIRSPAARGSRRLPSSKSSVREAPPRKTPGRSTSRSAHRC